MTCTICGRYAEPDRETGWDAGQFCSEDCAKKAFDVDPIESDLHDLGSVLASLAEQVKDCHDPAKLFDVYSELGKLSRGLMELQDKVGFMQTEAFVKHLHESRQ